MDAKEVKDVPSIVEMKPTEKLEQAIASDLSVADPSKEKTEAALKQND